MFFLSQQRSLAQVYQVTRLLAYHQYRRFFKNFYSPYM